MLDSLLRVKRFIFLLCFLVGAACAQEQHNFLAVDNVALDSEVGPYYFIAQGNSSDAYARATPLARALGVQVDYDAITRELVFRSGERTVVLQATSDVAQGLQKREGALTVNGQSRASPQAILVDGSSYVAIGPLVDALGGDSDWDPASLVLFIDSPAKLAENEPEAASGAQLAQPRYAFHENRSRIALNLPVGSRYNVLVADNRFVVVLPELRAAGFAQALDDPYLETISFAELDGDLALSIETRYPLSADGRGYDLGLLPADSSRPEQEVLYIDFAPDLRGESAGTLNQSLSVQTAAAARAPVSRKVVVIDAGHGGHDPGASSTYATEKSVVLAISERLARLLEAQGFEVILTRDSDFFLTLQQRADFAKPDINLFVSIHANAATSAQAYGVETWVFGQPLNEANLALAIEENGGGAEGQELTQRAIDVANNITGSLMREGQLSYSLTLADMVQREMVAATGARDRGVQQNAFYVIRNARSPAILVEVGFVSNPDEGSKLASDAYQSLLAEALANGIQDFFEQGTSLAQY